MPPPRATPALRRRHGAARFASGLAIGLVAAWLAGFVWFIGVSIRAPELPPQADGIVALTGGAERIPAALRLLRDGRAGKLLISGVGGDVTLPVLGRGSGVDVAALAGRITIGRDATTTTGNAEEAAAWARANALHSLIVVTAGYHMARALTEIGRTLPDVRLYPMPVQPPALRGAARLSSLRLLAGEYSKFLAAAAGLTRLEHGTGG